MRAEIFGNRTSVSQFTLNPIRHGTASNLGMKSLLHPMRSTALSSLRSCYSMNMLCRFFSLSITIVVCSLTTASAQNLPNTPRLLRFPTTNDRDIVFCYAGQLYTVGKDGGTARRLTSGPGYTSFSRFSPDGTQIAFNSDRHGEMNLYVHSLVDDSNRQVTKGPSGDFQPQWSPDGKRLVFFASRAGNADI